MSERFARSHLSPVRRWSSTLKQSMGGMELTPLRMTLIYLAFGMLALFLSDVLFVTYLSEPLLSQVQAMKGGVEVALTAALIFGLTTRSLRQQRETTRALERHRDELQLLHRVFRHNLRNDLNVVLMYADLAMKRVRGEEARKMCEHIAETTGEIVAYSERTQRIRKVPEFGQHTFDLSETVAEIIADQPNDGRDLDVITSIPEGLSVRANAMFDEALAELLSNSITHCEPDKATVHISADPSAGPRGMVEICFQDDGPGIPEYEIESLEEPGDNQLLHPTGLGLWFADWVISHSDGDLVIRSDGLGSEICLHVPVAPDEQNTDLA